MAGATARVAVVTGGGTGIGHATAHRLAADGFAVAICGRRLEPLKAVEAEIAASDGRCLARQCDIREPDQVTAFIDDVLSEFSQVDALVNNAGGQFAAPAEDITLKGFRAVHRLAVDGAWSMTREVATRAFIPQRSGSVVFLGFSPARGMLSIAHAASARGAVQTLATSLAIEWARYGIRSNCVNIGTIRTEGLQHYDQEEVASWAATIPLKRFGTPEEVANVIAFIVSDEASYVTGSVLTVDGGADVWGIGGNPPDLV